MTPTHATASDSVLALRREFDIEFSRLPRAASAPVENLLAVRVGAAPYAIRVSEIAGLFVDRRIVPLPALMPELLGLAAFRGQVAPVYDLAALLGCARAGVPRWLVLARLREPLALAFDAFDAHLSLVPDHMVAPSAEPAPEGPPDPHAEHRHVRGAVRADDVLRPIIQLQSVVVAIQQRVNAIRSTEERQA